MLIKNACLKCGEISEARLEPSGPHIKQLCNGCGTYTKFIAIRDIPRPEAIKNKIWAITQDLEIINFEKGVIEFNPDEEGVNLSLEYWRLYLKIIEYASKKPFNT